MGKNQRARLEQQRAKEKLHRRIRAGAAGVALLAAGTTAASVLLGDKGDTVEASLQDAKIAFDRQYGCKNIGKITIKVHNLSEQALNPYGDGSEGTGFTKDNEIHIRDDVPKKEAANALTHEMVHACVNAKPDMFKTPYEFESGLSVTGAIGFEVWFSDSTPEKPNTFVLIGEGAAEWIAEGVQGYEPSSTPGYTALRKLTNELSAKANLNRNKLADMYEASDLIGFISAVNGTSKDETTASQVASFIHLYDDTFKRGAVPSSVELAEAYGIGR